MQELFTPFGQISRIYVAYDRDTGENRGFAFVNFVHRWGARSLTELLRRQSSGLKLCLLRCLAAALQGLLHGSRPACLHQLQQRHMQPCRAQSTPA